MSKVKIDDRDWSKLSFGRHVYQLEVEGYTVMPDLLSSQHLERLQAETAALNTFAVDYSVKQQVRPRTQFVGGAITRLIAHPPTVQFLERLFGDEIVFMSYAYARSEPGHPGISIHTDGQPYGSEIFGYEGSCPCMVRVLYYLQDSDGGGFALPRGSPFPPGHARARQPLSAIRVAPGRGHGDGRGRLRRADQPSCLSWQLPKRRRLCARAAGNCLPSSLGGPGCRGG